MAEIEVRPGRIALVDDDDVALVSRFRWRVLTHKKSNISYAVANVNRNERVLMHRLIVGAVRGQLIDHENHDGLDNRRSNLRSCSSQQNAFNRRVSSGTKSGLKGVRYDGSSRRRKCWRAQATLNGKNIDLGRFYTVGEAHEAYKSFIAQEHGSFACAG